MHCKLEAIYPALARKYCPGKSQAVWDTDTLKVAWTHWVGLVSVHLADWQSTRKISWGMGH